MPKVIFLILATVVVLVPYAPFLFVAEAAVLDLAKEDGVVETLGALFFLVAGLGWLGHARKGGGWLAASLGLLFLFGFAEEISWGQRVFGFNTPDAMADANSQGEANIHNLEIFHGVTEDGERKTGWAVFLNIDRLFSLFWFSFCLVVPALDRFVPSARVFFARLRMPIVPLWLGPFFLVNYVVMKLLEGRLNNALQHSLQEVKEGIFAALFLLVALYFFTSPRSGPERTSA